MNHKKIIIGILIFLVIAVIALFIAKAAKDKKAANAADPTKKPVENTGNTMNLQPQTPAAPAPNKDFPIFWNVKSEAVQTLQAALGVTQDGIVGEKTLAALNKATGENYPGYSLFYIADKAALDKIIDKVINKQMSASVWQPWVFSIK